MTDTVLLSLQGAIKQALVHGIPVRKARWEHQMAALQRVEQRRKSLLPNVRLSAQADYVPALPTTFLPAPLFSGQEGTYAAVTLGQPWQVLAAVHIEQPLIDAAAQRLASAAAPATALQDLLVEQAEEEVILQTATVFYQALQVQASLRALEVNLAQLEALQRMAQLRVDNDQAVRTDVQRLQVAIASLQARRSELESAREALHQNLQFLCGLSAETLLVLVDTGDLVHPELSVLPAKQTTMYRLLENRLSILRHQERSNRAAGWPKLSCYAQAGILSQRADFRFTASDGRWYPLAIVGLRLDWALLEGFRRRPSVERLLLEIQRGEEECNDFTRMRAMELRQAKMQWDNALRTLRAREQALSLARDVAGQLQLAYQNGVAPLSELLSAQSALAEAETQYEQQLFTYRLAQVKWLKAAGLLRSLIEN
ncbi:MAG: TolC family protein [Saprospiraceae bacterium]|nr:TolC family protein [Saprospiraceae bacterium]MDW8484296.1 TolC family protein [Saprospiraceae bacterium]